MEHRKQDSEFKSTLTVKDFVKDNGSRCLGGFYIPDVVLENNDTDAVIFFESSTTNDRKVHIGELTQFLTYINTGQEKRGNAYLVLFLNGCSASSPTAETEFQRLQYYFNNFMMKNSERDKIKGIYIANQSEVDICKLTLDSIKEFKRIDL